MVFYGLRGVAAAPTLEGVEGRYTMINEFNMVNIMINRKLPEASFSIYYTVGVGCAEIQTGIFQAGNLGNY